MTRTTRSALMFSTSLLAIGLLAPVTHATWPVNGVTLAPPGLGDQSAPEIASDGEGGAVIVWAELRAGTGYDIVAQRVDAWGRPVWAATGVVLCNAGLDQQKPQVVSDGAGGAIAVWEDGRNADLDIFAQRVSAQGTPMWTANGVAVCVLTSFQQAPRLVRDGGNGAIITWEDIRPSPSAWDIYAQRINGSGIAQWVINGNLVCGDVGGQYQPRITTDGAGGAIIAWEHEVSFQFDVRAQRIGAGGNVMWGTGYVGIPVCANGTNQDQITIASDGGGGAILAWRDQRTGVSNATIFARRITADGTPVWTADGVDICSATGPEQDARIVSDGANGAIISWYDTRVGAGEAYVQRISLAGAVQWTAAGVLVSDHPSQSLVPRLAADGIGGAIVSWVDLRYQAVGDIFARRVSAAGTVQGPLGGVPMGVVPGFKTSAAIASDGAGGAIVAWSDSRPGTYVLAKAQRLDRFNNWGYPSGDIVSAKDVPGDQGGVVNVEWTASRLDPWPSESIDRYTVWRAIDPTLANVFATAGTSIVSIEDLDPLATDAIRVENVAGTTYYWQLMATVDAYGLNSYAQAVPTLFDSTATSPGNHYFQVIAHGFTPQEYWTSAPASGKSTDNIAPAAPLLLTAQRVGNDVLLNWNPSGAMEADFQHYAVYRAIGMELQPPPTFLSFATDTLLVDASAPGGHLYYIVKAVDVHGNESAPSNEAMVTIPTGIGGDAPSLTRLTLDVNVPNPFSASTDLRIGLPRASDVRLEIFDVAGRRVVARDVPRMDAGWQRVTFDGRDAHGRPLASGVYFGRITAAGERQTMKMVIQR